MADCKGYTADEAAWLEANYLLPTGEYHRQFCERFDREIPASRLKSYRTYRGWKTGCPTRFPKGNVPSNKGKGASPNAIAARLKPGYKGGGHRRPIGAETVNGPGFRVRKVSDDGPHRWRWKLVHILEWEAAHGPVPADMVLKCKGERSDVNPSNFELVPRAILPRLYGIGGRDLVAYDAAPAELKPSILAVARLEHATARLGAGD